MRKFEVKIEDLPHLEHPVFFEGLPGVGNVGRTAVKHMVSLFEATKFGEIRSTTFPHQVRSMPDGTLRLMRDELYHARSPIDAVFLVGDMQPLPTEFASHYEMAEIVLDLCQELDVSLIVALGGQATGDTSDVRQVVAAGSSPEVVNRLEALGIEFLKDDSEMPIVGLSGLLPALAAQRSIDAVCLLGQTMGEIRPDAKAATAVLEKVSLILEAEIDVSSISDAADSIEGEMNSLMKRIEKLERARPSSTQRDNGYIH